MANATVAAVTSGAAFFVENVVSGGIVFPAESAERTNGAPAAAGWSEAVLMAALDSGGGVFPAESAGIMTGALLPRDRVEQRTCGVQLYRRDCEFLPRRRG